MQAVEIRDTENLSQTEWLDIRKQGIGGSDAAAICGLSRWKSPMELWLEKTGQIEPEKAGEAAYWGQIMEPIIREEFSIRTGLKIKPLNTMLQHKRFPFMLANLDGIVIDPKRGQGVFEAKTAGLYSMNEWNDSLPDEYAIQVQHYLAVTNLPYACVAVLIGGNKFKWLHLERDDAAIDIIIQLESRFWKAVETRTPPPMDGSRASTELLNRLYPYGQKRQIELPPEALDLIEAYEEAKKQEEKASTLKDTAVNHLKSMLGENDTGIIGDRKVTWQKIKTERFDSKLFKAEEPETYARYIKPSSYRRFQIK